MGNGAEQAQVSCRFRRAFRLAEKLGREPNVAVMKPANHREFDDFPLVRRLYLLRFRVFTSLMPI